ncbi:hypothetical protein [Arsenicicoccus bolidensis]|uniref:Uncharacterized protein n=1 Tax=Arsenicicoccus bolidensis TaxID=229480 RepID=A0ABS9PXZ6_9MICO|nr:hypothetical protein [Arsenicicoccus bolidensis]MCG7320501.1 hypothetical protein [Arsenicicoccus bolidensis]
MRTPLLPPEIVDGKWYTTDQLDRLGLTRAQRRQLVAASTDDDCHGP